MKSRAKPRRQSRNAVLPHRHPRESLVRNLVYLLIGECTLTPCPSPTAVGEGSRTLGQTQYGPSPHPHSGERLVQNLVHLFVGDRDDAAVVVQAHHHVEGALQPLVS